MALPPDSAITRVKVEHTRDGKIQDQTLNMESKSPAEKSYALVLNTEHTVESTPATLQLQAPQPLNIERETGSFSIAADDMTVSVDTTTGLRQVNAPKDSLAAFRFYGRPFELNARVQRIEPLVKI